MIAIFRSLLPLQIESSEIIFGELDPVEMVLFISEGTVNVGFIFNSNEKKVIRIKKENLIGGFECSYDQRSVYVYKVGQPVQGYFIHKKSWRGLEEINPKLY
jgi:hypothetical protein